MCSQEIVDRRQTMDHNPVILYKFGKHWIIKDDFILFTRSIIAILPILKGHNPVMHEGIWPVFERNFRALMDI